MLPTPPLPPTWPYAPRGASAPLEHREGQRLPGLDGLWTLEAVAGLDLATEGADLAGAFGRGGVLRAGPVVLRPYRRGGLLRHVNGGLYTGPGRFRREFQVHRALWDAGLPTVEPLGWAHRRRLWGSEGVFLSRYAEGVPWPRAWERREILGEVRRLLEALCAWGLLAPDLNATNILLAPQGGILALDWDQARWAPGPGLMARYRERLTRSLRKLGAPAALVAELWA
jgi:hypothetical protein